MKMKNLFKTAVFAGTLAVGCAAAINFAPSVDAYDHYYVDYEGVNCYCDGYSPLEHKVNYGNGNLLKMVKPGDIFYDANGSSGIAGHVAIIEGVFWDENFSQPYIRTIEADGKKVKRNCLELDYYVSRPNEHTIVRLNGARMGWSSFEEKMIKYEAIDFCIEQIDKGYLANIFVYPHTNGDKWYCSELIWAAYYNVTGGKVDFNINDSTFDKFMWPKEMRDAWEYVDDIGAYVIGNEVYQVSYSCASNNRYAIVKDGRIIGYENCHFVAGSDGRTIRCTKCGQFYTPGC